MTEEHDIDELARRIRDGYSAPGASKDFVQTLGRRLNDEMKMTSPAAQSAAAASDAPARPASPRRVLWPALVAAGTIVAIIAVGFMAAHPKEQKTNPTFAQRDENRPVTAPPPAATGRPDGHQPTGDVNMLVESVDGRLVGMNHRGNGGGSLNEVNRLVGTDSFAGTEARFLTSLPASRPDPISSGAAAVSLEGMTTIPITDVTIGMATMPASAPTSMPTALRAGGSLVDGLVALWKGDGDAKDSVGEHHGQLQGGIEYAQGRSGKAFKMDGRDGRMTAGDTLNWGDGSWTASLWYKSTADRTKNAALLIKGRTTYGTPRNAGYHLFLVEDSMIQFSVGDAAGTDVSIQAREPAVNQWHHVAGVLDRAGGELRLYVDGKLADKKAISGLGNLDTNIPTSLGCLDRGQFGPLEAPFDGCIDDAAMWKRALSAEEIDAIFQATSLQDALWLSGAVRPQVVRLTESDRVTLTDGTILPGTIRNEKYTLATSFGKREVPAARVAGIFVHPDKKGVASLILTDGQVLLGTPADEALDLKLSTGSSLSIPLSKVRECAYAITTARPEVQATTRPMLVLAGGQWLAIDGDGPAMKLQTALGPCELPLKAVQDIVAADSLNTRHIIRLSNGTILTGTLPAEAITLKLSLGGAATCARKDIRQIVLGGKGLKESPDAQVRTRGGDVLAGALACAEVTVRTKFGPVSVPSASIASIDFDANNASVVSLKQWDGVVAQGTLTVTELPVTLCKDGPTLKVSIAQIAGVTCPYPQPPPDTLKKIRQLVSQLGAESYKDRESAMTELTKMGPNIAPALRKMPASTDPEVRARVELIFDALGQGAASPATGPALVVPTE